MLIVLFSSLEFIKIYSESFSIKPKSTKGICISFIKKKNIGWLESVNRPIVQASS